MPQILASSVHRIFFICNLRKKFPWRETLRTDTDTFRKWMGYCQFDVFICCWWFYIFQWQWLFLSHLKFVEKMWHEFRITHFASQDSLSLAVAVSKAKYLRSSAFGLSIFKYPGLKCRQGIIDSNMYVETILCRTLDDKETGIGMLSGYNSGELFWKYGCL